jgi:pantoate--beta-alanine ligase
LDKEYKINLIEEDTKRTKTGLALSSRNKLLSQEGLIKAENIYKALALIQNELNNSKNLIEIINKGKSLLVSENIHLDYLEILDMNTFLPPNESSSDLVVIIAVLIDGVRLIDNIQFKYEEIK